MCKNGSNMNLSLCYLQTCVIHIFSIHYIYFSKRVGTVLKRFVLLLGRHKSCWCLVIHRDAALSFKIVVSNISVSRGCGSVHTVQQHLPRAAGRFGRHWAALAFQNPLHGNCQQLRHHRIGFQQMVATTGGRPEVLARFQVLGEQFCGGGERWRSFAVEIYFYGGAEGWIADYSRCGAHATVLWTVPFFANTGAEAESYVPSDAVGGFAFMSSLIGKVCSKLGHVQVHKNDEVFKMEIKFLWR